jgi:hypothetical protein
MPSKKIIPTQIQVGEKGDATPASNQEGDSTSTVGKTRAKSPLICVWMVFLFLSVGCIISFQTISDNMRAKVIETYEYCSTSAPVHSTFADPPTQSKLLYVHNMTNPYDFFVQGEDAELHEIGPYHLIFNNKNRNIEFMDDKISYINYGEYQYDSKKSCPLCKDPYEKVYSTHVAYNTIIYAARSEATFLMAQACTPTQIMLGQSTNMSIPFCTAEEQLTPAECKCCWVQSPVAGAIACASLVQPTAKAAGRLSWLAKYEGGLKVSAAVNPAGFPLAPGVYTAFSRETTPMEMAFGTPSPLVGFFFFASAAAKAKDAMAAYTKDVGSVCLPLHCPSIADILGVISSMDKTSGYAYLKDVECVGRIQGYEELIDQHGFSVDQAKSLRYLEGINCRSYTPTLVTAALIANNSWPHACQNSSETVPCCLSVVLGEDGIRGPGWGCLQHLPGFVINRRVYTPEDAIMYAASDYTVRGTNCADKEDRLVVFEDNGLTDITRWVTPSTYSYPDMPW